MVSGGVSALADVALLTTLVFVGVARVAATPAAFLASAFLNYALHRRFTFQTRRAASGRQFFRFGCVIAFNMLLTSATVEGMTAAGFVLIISKLVSLPIIAVSGFVLSRTFVFTSEVKP